MQSIITKKLREGYSFNALQYVKEGIENFLSNWLQYLAVALLTGIFTVFIVRIPMGSFAYSFLIAPLLSAGYYIVAEKKFRNEHTTFQDFLGGTPYFGGLVLATFLQVLAVVGAVILVAIVLTYPIVALVKGYDFSNGFMASGALLPVIGLSVIAAFIIIAIYIWYLFAYNYVVFGKMEGSEAMSISRKMVTKAYGPILLFFFTLFMLGMSYSLIVMYLTGQFEIFKELFQAIINQDQDTLKNMKPDVDIKGQLISVVASAIFAPIYHCIIQAAFRDIHEMDKEDKIIDNTIEHLVD
jgi:hypothetical protein